MVTIVCESGAMLGHLQCRKLAKQDMAEMFTGRLNGQVSQRSEVSKRQYYKHPFPRISVL